MPTRIPIASERARKRCPKAKSSSCRLPTQTRAIASHDAILAATARILRDDGLPGLTTNRVAERAGVGIATLYAYFPNKYALVLGLARQMLAEDESTMLRALDATSPADPVDRLLAAILENHTRDPEIRRVAISMLIGAGYGSELAKHASGIIETIASRAEAIEESAIGLADPVRMFVVTRAVLGVARALTNESEIAPDPAQLFAELTRLVRLVA